MQPRRTFWLSALVLGCSGCAAPAHLPQHGGPAPPQAQRVDHLLPSPFGTRNDEYYWLRDDRRERPEVLAHLAAENAYTEAMLAPGRGARDLLLREMAGRIKPDDFTVPWKHGDYWYYTRFDPGAEQPVHARRLRDLDAPEQVLIDGPALSKGLAYYDLGAYALGRDQQLLAWTDDRVGRRQFRLHFRDLAGQRRFGETIDNVEPDIAFAQDSVVYVDKDPVTLLGVRVKRHRLGTDPALDTVLYEEHDRRFFLSVANSRSERYVFIRLDSTLSSEQWYADVDDPELRFTCMLAREPGHEYEAEDAGDRFILRSNWQAPNFRLVSATPDQLAAREQWQELLPARADALVEEFLVFQDRIALAERSAASRRIRVLRLADGAQTEVAAAAPSYVMAFGENPDPASRKLRYLYSSLTTPATTYELDLDRGDRRQLKQDAVLGGFDPGNYQAELVYAPAPDGARVPVSLVYRRGTPRDGSAPLYLHGYGAYGLSDDPVFRASQLSLLDRGFVLALAHVRGGQEQGMAWYEQGRGAAKPNTFSDFIAATEFLVRERYAAADKVVAVGASAGGLLMGAIANQRPDLYRAIVAHVPFVDALTTSLDDSIPLTSNEHDEWGDPHQREGYESLLSYSPYDNVGAHAYPAMLVTTALWDSQVQYFEPVKWVARLRARKTDANPLLLHIDLNAGHDGRSGRYAGFADTALEYGFIFQTLGLPVRRLLHSRPAGVVEYFGTRIAQPAPPRD